MLAVHTEKLRANLEKAVYCGLTATTEPIVESSWVGHVPFLQTLIAQLRPVTYLELGVFNGCSYFAASAALKAHGNGQCIGVDTWLGDVHCGDFNQSVYGWFKARRDKFYPESKIIQSTFSDALNEVEDASIDILHIDGTHTYEAVKEDFSNWLPKVADGGVILLHDTMEKKEDFGVWKLWDEITSSFDHHFNFEHSHGLGVVVKGTPSAELELLVERFSKDAFLRERFATAGKNLTSLATLHTEKQQLIMKLNAANVA